jgi:hydrogenase expression/formation protein HypC
VLREACIETLPEAQVGDYTIVHAGFALNITERRRCAGNLELLREMSIVGR